MSASTLSLSRVQDASKSELSEFAGEIQKFVNEENEAAMADLLERMDRRPGLMSRLLPTPVEKEQNRVAVQRLRNLAGSKEAMLALYTELHMEIARQQGDALIASVGMHLQAQLASFATAKMDELQVTIEESRSRFLTRYAPQKAEIEQVREEHPELYERARENLMMQLDGYFQTLEALLKGFQAALTSRARAA